MIVTFRVKLNVLTNKEHGDLKNWWRYNRQFEVKQIGRFKFEIKFVKTLGRRGLICLDFFEILKVP